MFASKHSLVAQGALLAGGVTEAFLSRGQLKL